MALAVRLRLARQLAQRDRAAAEAAIDQIEHETADALDNLRDLARGIYPPLLADRGLVAALSAQAAKSPLPVAVEANGVARYAQEQEAAVYFCTLEALQNVAKYAGATRAVVRLAVDNGHLAFEVTDEGPGIPPEHQSRIFDRFFQVDQTSTRRVGGTGLGLYLVKNLTEAVGGHW